MFKKDPQPKASANIKSSERRQLLQTICKQFNLNKDELPKEKELELLPATIKQASYQSIQGHKGTIYFDLDEKPIWFKTRDSQLYPSVYTLWQAGGILPIILTNPFVIGKLIENANLMLPGCLPPFDNRALRGALVGVASYKEPTVIKAIGHCSLNLTQFNNVQGRQGTAVTILHTIEDELYKMYDKDFQVPELVPPIVPNAYDSVNATLKSLFEDDEESDEEADEASDGEADGEADEDAQDAQDNNGQEETVEETDQTEGEKPADDLDDVSEAVEELLVEDVDTFYVRAFIQLVKLNPKIDLPLSASKLMADYVLKNLPRMDPKYCNIKKTSWKKSSKFLKALEKKKYISLKGKEDDLNVIAITVDPQTVANFVTHKTMDQAKGSGATPSKKDLDQKLNVVKLYKPTSKTKAVLSSLGLSSQNYYTQPELKNIINDYIKKELLADKKSPKFVNINEGLKAATGIKDPQTTRDKLLNPFTASFSPHYSIVKPGESIESPKQIHKGSPPQIKILTLTVLGRKKVTTVVNFENFYIRPATLSEELKNKCSGSTTVGQSVHNPNLTEVMVQGPHGPTIIDYLKSKGVPIQYIDFEDKSKGKKKRG